ncbi:hypothetical protein V6N13_096519 [Hibiscus sabdariffa]|uniref:Sulfotransferase n=1 Tax=Hibiscus sabdariffa TaxID=183260 RepID=A0ABR2DFG3_9ROSI
MIPALPKRKSWGILEDYFQYQVFWLHPTFLKGVVSAQQKLQAQSTDIMLCNLPKTGTTWLKSLIFAIVTRASFDDSTSPLLSKMPHELVPFMELYHADFPMYRDLGVPVLATHVPYPSLPRSILDSGCKIVYICRNPKDSFVSLYHFNTTILTSRNLQPLGLDEAFEMFCEGVSFYGPYWDHVLGDEEMKDDTVLYAKKLAEFICHPFSSEEHQQEVPEKIVKMCSFENLSNLEANRSEKRGIVQNKMYFRKGKVGDWTNCLTSEMAERLDRITQQKLSGSGLSIRF